MAQLENTICAQRKLVLQSNIQQSNEEIHLLEEIMSNFPVFTERLNNLQIHNSGVGERVATDIRLQMEH